MDRKFLRSTLAAAALTLHAASVLAAGQVTLFQGPGFRGPAAAANDAVPDLGYALDGGASSVVVTSGSWEACSDTYFRGRCAQLTPGNYSALSYNLDGPVLSVRPVETAPAAARIVVSPDATPVAVTSAPAPVVVSPAPAQIVVNAVPAQVVVNPAPTTVVVNPVAATATVSVAPAEATVAVQAVGRKPNVAPGRAVLYQFPNFGVPSAIIQDGRAPDLDWANFRYPAESLRVESGRWLVCTENGYQGQCAVLGPGDYPVLSGTLSPGIASMWPIA